MSAFDHQDVSPSRVSGGPLSEKPSSTVPLQLPSLPYTECGAVACSALDAVMGPSWALQYGTSSLMSKLLAALPEDRRAAVRSQTLNAPARERFVMTKCRRLINARLRMTPYSARKRTVSLDCSSVSTLPEGTEIGPGSFPRRSGDTNPLNGLEDKCLMDIAQCGSSSEPAAPKASQQTADPAARLKESYEVSRSCRELNVSGLSAVSVGDRSTVTTVIDCAKTLAEQDYHADDGDRGDCSASKDVFAMHDIYRHINLIDSLFSVD